MKDSMVFGNIIKIRVNTSNYAPAVLFNKESIQVVHKHKSKVYTKMIFYFDTSVDF